MEAAQTLNVEAAQTLGPDGPEFEFINAAYHLR